MTFYSSSTVAVLPHNLLLNKSICPYDSIFNPHKRKPILDDVDSLYRCYNDSLFAINPNLTSKILKFSQL